jgi:hypothetical protein
MASPLPIDPDTIAIASATSDVASSDLVVALTTVQAAAAASSERVATVEAASQQEHAAMAAAAATAPTDLAAALATLQARIAAAALELQLAAVLRATAPPPRPATVAATTLGQAAPRSWRVRDFLRWLPPRSGYRHPGHLNPSARRPRRHVHPVTAMA